MKKSRFGFEIEFFCVAHICAVINIQILTYVVNARHYMPLLSQFVEFSVGNMLHSAPNNYIFTQT